MENNHAIKLSSLKLIIEQLDKLRALQYADPDNLRSAEDYEDIAGIIRSCIPGWDEFLDRYIIKVKNTKKIVQLSHRIRFLDLSLIATYVTFLGLNLFTDLDWPGKITPWATGILFLYFIFIWGSESLLANRPVKPILEEYFKETKKTKQGIKRAITKLVYLLDETLLESGQIASNYSLKLHHADYPGIFIIAKPARFGGRFYQVFPFPLHPVLVNSRGGIKILLASYRDDKLLKALTAVPISNRIQIVATEDISDHSLFQKATEEIKTLNKQTSVILSKPLGNLKGAFIQTQDGTWQLDFGSRFRPLELKYSRITDEEQVENIKENFSQAVADGEKIL